MTGKERVQFKGFTNSFPLSVKPGTNLDTIFSKRVFWEVSTVYSHHVGDKIKQYTITDDTF